jgi:hypothetical protein
MVANTFIKQALKENLKEASAAGFDTARRWYHGGKKGMIGDIDPSKFGSKTGTPAAKEAFFLVDDPAIAEGFAKNAKGDVHEFLYRPENTVTIDWDELYPGLSIRSNNGQRALAGLLQDVKDQGAAGVLIRNADDTATESGKKGNVLAVLDETRLRYPQAEFKDNSSAKTMAQIGGAAVGVGALATATENAEASQFTPEQQAAIDRARSRLEAGPSQSGFTPEQQAAIERAKARVGGQEQSAQPQRRVASGRGIYGQRHQNQKADNQAAIANLRQQSLNQGIPFVRDLPEIGMAPEMNEFSMPAFLASAGATFTFDDQEVGDILGKQLGAKMGQDLEGNYFVTMPSGENYAINKPGISGQDAIKFAASGAAFAPSGALPSIAKQAAGGALTQAGIEAGQSAVGGSVNPLEVGLAAAAPVVMAKAMNAGKRIVNGTRSQAASQYLDDLEAGAISSSPKNIEAQQAKAASQKIPIFETTGRQQARQGLASGTVEGVGWKVGRRGQIVADKVERDIVKAGVDERAIVALNRMSSGDKKQANRMLNLARDYFKGVKGSEEMTPNTIIGERMMARFKTVANFQKKASRDIGLAVRKNASTKVDTAAMADDFLDTLEKLGVSYDDDKFDFALSDLARSNTGAIKTAYKRLVDGRGDFDELHRLKRFIYEQVDFGTDPASASKLSQKGEEALKGLASSINKKLREVSDDYALANDQFKEAAEVVYPFAKAMGRRFNPEFDRIEQLVGQELRKTLTNYASAQPMISSYKGLDAMARGLGGEFDDDIGNLIVLNSELERIGSFRAGSLQGVQEKVGEMLLDQAGNTGRVMSAVYNEAKDRVFWSTQSQHRLEAVEKMRELIQRPSK